MKERANVKDALFRRQQNKEARYNAQTFDIKCRLSKACTIAQTVGGGPTLLTSNVPMTSGNTAKNKPVITMIGKAM
jgi:hypothetical protein